LKSHIKAVCPGLTIANLAPSPNNANMVWAIRLGGFNQVLHHKPGIVVYTPC
jgi:hypothetical protein